MSTPFNLQDIHLFFIHQMISANTTNPTVCTTAKLATLLFTTQNNRVKGKSTVCGTMDHPRACVVVATWRYVAQLQQRVAAVLGIILSFGKIKLVNNNGDIIKLVDGL